MAVLVRVVPELEHRPETPMELPPVVLGPAQPVAGEGDATIDY